MKQHLIKHKGLVDDYGWLVTYCKIHSENWSEKFAEDLNSNLVETIDECTCKRCIQSYNKEENNKVNQLYVNG